MIDLPPRLPLSAHERAKHPGLRLVESFRINDDVSLSLAARQDDDVILLADAVFGISGPIRLTGQEALLFARTLLQILQTAGHADRLADLPRHWMDGPGGNGATAQPSPLAKALAWVTRRRPSTRYTVNQRVTLVVSPSRTAAELRLEEADLEYLSLVVLGYRAGELIARTILALLGDKPVYRETNS